MSPQRPGLSACRRAVLAALVLAGQLFATVLPAAVGPASGLSREIAATICHAGDDQPAGEPGHDAPAHHDADCPLCPSCAAIPMAALLPPSAARPPGPQASAAASPSAKPEATGPPATVFARPQPTGPPALHA